MEELPAWRDLINPVLDALRQLGGSARPGEVHDWIVDSLNLSDELVAQENRDGVRTLYNRIAWARFYLARASFLDSSRRGVWALTEKGRNAGRLTEAALRKLQKDVQDATRRVADPVAPQESDPNSDGEADEPVASAFLAYREDAKATLNRMTPTGFERFCQRLLREAGFESVEITGQSGDAGIDGRGVLRVNPLASFNVVFQCKRYSGSTVGSPEVRNFRGAMEGRADRGLLITTATFTREAEKEAARDGVMPIELVDGDGIVDLMEQLHLGLNPVSSFELEAEFFDDYVT